MCPRYFLTRRDPAPWRLRCPWLLWWSNPPPSGLCRAPDVGRDPRDVSPAPRAPRLWSINTIPRIAGKTYWIPAEQLTVVPPFIPRQDQFHNPVLVILDAFPAGVRSCRKASHRKRPTVIFSYKCITMEGGCGTSQYCSTCGAASVSSPVFQPTRQWKESVH